MDTKEDTLVPGSAWEWFAARAHGRHAIFWLVLVCFLEPIILPFFPESLMIAMILAGRQHWKKYSAIAAVASAAGGIVGYGIGAFLFRSFGGPLLNYYDLHHWFRTVHGLLEGNVFLVMLFLIVSPVPDKVVVILAGFFHAPFMPFAVGFFLGRCLRYGVMGYLAYRFGPHVIGMVRRYFEILAIALIAVFGYALLHTFHLLGL